MTSGDGPSGAPGARAEALSLDGFLERVIEGYLFGDLRAMTAEIKPKEGGELGDACFPTVMAVLAGSELVGDVANGVDGGVEYYWTRFMKEIDLRYRRLAPVARGLLRNGLMHSYLPKQVLGIQRGDPAEHLTTHPDGLHVFDSVVLAEHFRDSYLKHAKPEILRTREKSEEGLAAILERHAKDAAKIPVPKGVFLPHAAIREQDDDLRHVDARILCPEQPEGPTSPQ